MTSMPNLYDIALLYDSIEGVNLYKPYLHLLQFFPTLGRVRILMQTNKTYYDINHRKVYEEETFDNYSVLFATNVRDFTTFRRYLPFYEFKGFDGTGPLSDEDYKIYRMFKRFWINPKFMIYYSKLKYHDLKKAREILIKLSKYGPDYRMSLGIDSLWYDFSKEPFYSWPDLNLIITTRLRFKVLGRKYYDNGEPDYSTIYGLFGNPLYNTNGHYILVNSRGSIISDYYEEGKGESKKLVNDLLPF